MTDDHQRYGVQTAKGLNASEINSRSTNHMQAFHAYMYVYGIAICVQCIKVQTFEQMNELNATMESKVCIYYSAVSNIMKTMATIFQQIFVSSWYT